MSRTGYAKLSNEFWRSPSVMEMLDTNPAALGYYVAAVSYASDNLTDGLIEERVAKHSLHVPEDVINFLVEIGKWEVVEGGWLIHNYAKWQNSREQIEAARERDRNRKANNRSEDIPNGIQTESENTPDGIQPAVNQNTKPKHNNQNDSSSDESNTPQTPHRDPDAYTPEFEAFWTAYPRRKAKRAAWKAWKAAVKRADPDGISDPDAELRYRRTLVRHLANNETPKQARERAIMAAHDKTPTLTTKAAHRPQRIPNKGITGFADTMRTMLDNLTPNQKGNQE